MVTGKRVTKVVQVGSATGSPFQAGPLTHLRKRPRHGLIRDVSSAGRADEGIRVIGATEPLVAGLPVSPQVSGGAVSDWHQTHREVLALTHDDKSLIQIHITILQGQHLADAQPRTGQQPNDGCIPQAGEWIASQRGLVCQALADQGRNLLRRVDVRWDCA